MRTGKHGERYMADSSTNSITGTCDMDGYQPSPTGVTEWYWHCEEPAIALLRDGLKLCQGHLTLWEEDFLA